MKKILSIVLLFFSLFLSCFIQANQKIIDTILSFKRIGEVVASPSRKLGKMYE